MMTQLHHDGPAMEVRRYRVVVYEVARSSIEAMDTINKMLASTGNGLDQSADGRAQWTRTATVDAGRLESRAGVKILQKVIGKTMTLWRTYASSPIRCDGVGIVMSWSCNQNPGEKSIHSVERHHS